MKMMKKYDPEGWEYCDHLIKVFLVLFVIMTILVSAIVGTIIWNGWTAEYWEGLIIMAFVATLLMHAGQKILMKIVVKIQKIKIKN